MAENRKSVGTIINEFEQNGRLTSTEASLLRDAPQWVIPFADIAAYLGGAVIFVGLVWIVAALMGDMSRGSIDVALFVVSFLTAFLSRWLKGKGGKFVYVGECVVAVSVMALAFAIGLLLDVLEVDDDIVLLVASLVPLVIGLILSLRTHFVGTVIVVVVMQPFVAGVIMNTVPDTSYSSLSYVVSGAYLLWFSTRKANLKILSRITGAVSIMLATFVFSIAGSNTWQPIIGLAITLCLFSYGARVYHLEIVAAGGVGVTVNTGILAGQLFDWALLQGLSVIAAGSIIVLLSVAISKRAKTVS